MMTHRRTGQRRLAIRPVLRRGEALDGYLERTAAANMIATPDLLAHVRDHPTAFLAIAPDNAALQRLATLTGQNSAALAASTLAHLAGIELGDLDPTDRNSWRAVAARGWPPPRGTQICPACLTGDGTWRIAWRHPWITTCLDHRTWLHAFCPTCKRRFRSQHHSPLRTVDSIDGTCSNPAGARGRTCSQALAALPLKPAPANVMRSQRRINSAIHNEPVMFLGQRSEPSLYLTELRALTVLLLHLAIQPDGKRMASWAAIARDDHDRSSGVRTARWALAPPSDPELRGHVLADADSVLNSRDLERAAEELAPWLDLTPRTPDGQLGWLADHTTMTPLLTRLIMAAASTRLRISTLLARQEMVPLTAIPQVLPADPYIRHVVGQIDVTDMTGRRFVSLCLARRGRPSQGWRDAAESIGLPGDLGVKTARTCSGRIAVSTGDLAQAIQAVAGDLEMALDYRRREATVRSLAKRSHWYLTWRNQHRPGTHATSHRYATTWLWTEYARAHLDTGPAWTEPPGARERALFRAFAHSLDPQAQDALLRVVSQQCTGSR